MGRIPVIVVLVAASMHFVGVVALAQEEEDEDGRYEVARSGTRDKPAPGRRGAASHI